MKKLIIVSMLSGATLLAACSNNSNSDDKKDATSAITDTSGMSSEVKYTCPMHPEVISDTPGDCPKCGMKMVPVKDSETNKK